MADAVPASSGALVNLLANPPNPMDQLQKTSNALTAAREFQAKQAIADAYRQATDPTTGEVDQGKLNAIISQTPGAFLQGQAMEQGGRGVQAQALGTSADLAARADQLSTAANYMAPLMQKLMQPDGTVTTDDVNAALDSIPPGVLPGSMINGMRTKLNALGPGADASNLVRGAMFANQHAMEVLKAVGPQTTAVTTGPSVQTFATNPLYQGPGPNLGRPGANVPLGLSPANRVEVQKFLQEPYDWTDPQGVEHRGGSKADWYAAHGVKDPLSLFNDNNLPTPGAAPAIPAAGPVSSVTTGRQPVGPPTDLTGGPKTPGQPQQPGAPQTVPPVPPPAPSQAPALPSTAALPAGTVKAGQEAYGSDLSMQGTLGTRVGPLESALSTLRAHPNMQTVGQDELNQLTELAHAFKLPIGDINNANAYQELGKYLAGYMRNLPGANRSDLASTEAAAASPHIGQGRDAMENLLSKAVGYERLRAAGVDYFHGQYPDETTAAQNSGQYNIKTRKWLSTQDPVAYSVDQMTPAQYADYFNGLSASDQEKFKASRTEAIKLYPWLRLPGGAAPAPAAPAAAPAPAGP